VFAGLEDFARQSIDIDIPRSQHEDSVMAIEHRSVRPCFEAVLMTWLKRLLQLFGSTAFRTWLVSPD
jgi:hypothetical protein